MDVSIVIPAFNEAQRLPPSLRRVAEFCAGYAKRCEVIIVVEKSADGTLELAREATVKQANFRVIENHIQRGKGYAVRTGMLTAEGRFVFYTDVDLSVPIEETTVFIEQFEKNSEYDVLVGNRQHARSRIERRQNWVRQQMGQTFNRVLRAFSLIDLHDTQCGFKGFRREAAREIFSRQSLDSFAFDVEVLLLAQALGYTIADLPVRWINSPESKVRIVRDSVQMLWDAMRIRAIVARSLRDKPPLSCEG